ncbi:MAG TPA: 3-dehydroquinate synthase [Ktedonobacteraceae bacterium]|nr:3-dehydroquinate synthase [Ktedonobacteraceae bacterium]
MQRLFLTGLAGSGKSTVGRLVAALLGWDFIDTDEIIATRTGLPTGQVLTDYGEERFREMESEALRGTAGRERFVVSTGGGCVTAEANRVFLREQGLNIYLQTSVETAWQRIQGQLHTKGRQVERPLVTGVDGLQRLRDLLAARQAWYEQATVHICADAPMPIDIAHEIIVSALAHGLVRTSASACFSSNLQVAGTLSQAVIEWGSLPLLPKALQGSGMRGRVFVVTDSTVGSLYADAVQTLLTRAGLDPHIFTVPAGESSKSFACFQQILDWLVQQHAERSEGLVALGGGVVGDLVGFVASCYRRGIPLVQIPTTLLAQVDSAIGGKTGINHVLGKNLIGAFYQPGLIFVDPAMLLTLPDRVYREGWAEIVKYGVILDEELFTMLERHLPDLEKRDADLLTSVVARCVHLKMDVVQGDERDSGVRNILNYGHTFGHALETVTEYGAWLHGEAVSIGMEVAGRIAAARGLLPPEGLARQRTLLQAIGLPTACPGGDSEALLAAMRHDKKVQDGRTGWILPTRIGHAQMYRDIPPELVREAVTAVCQAE